MKLIYEIETVIITSTEASLSTETVKHLLDPIHQYIFAYTVASQQAVFVQFIHADVLKRWLPISKNVQHTLKIHIKPYVECIDELDDINHTQPIPGFSNAALSTISKESHSVLPMTVNLRQSWTAVANHPVFSIEYKNYISRLINGNFFMT